LRPEEAAQRLGNAGDRHFAARLVRGMI